MNLYKDVHNLMSIYDNKIWEAVVGGEKSKREETGNRGQMMQSYGVEVSVHLVSQPFNSKETHRELL